MSEVALFFIEKKNMTNLKKESSHLKFSPARSIRASKWSIPDVLCCFVLLRIETWKMLLEENENFALIKESTLEIN